MAAADTTFLAALFAGPTPEAKPTLKDFAITIWVAFGLLAARLAYEAAAVPPIRRYIENARGPGHGKAAVAMMDNLWIAGFSGALAAFAWYVTVTANGGCTPWSPAACFVNWPDHPVAMGQRWFMVLGFAYYLYELIGTVLRVGTKLKADMIAHHLVSMALTLIAYHINLKRMCVMWQALFDVSNPILHVAKALHASGVQQLGGVKWFFFNLFAITFLVCRVIGGPISIVWPSFTVAATVLPPHICYPCWVLIAFVQLLQFLWFYKIIEIALKGEKAADKED